MISTSLNPYRNYSEQQYLAKTRYRICKLLGFAKYTETAFIPSEQQRECYCTTIGLLAPGCRYRLDSAGSRGACSASLAVSDHLSYVRRRPGRVASRTGNRK